ncbi:MAG: Methylmalonyl-CoA carboxyltransferase 12S subunit [Flavobacteriaceae bacterium]|nr:MAG: Methylmalonyl-CoA carboxyltransferase 12S subunit [Flavobacteriaceae bacterium]
MKKTKKQLENEIHHRNAVKELQSILGEVYLGGGKKRLEKKRSEGKLTARERISYLLDKNTPYQEIGALTAHNQYQDHGGCPSAGVITILGYVNNRLCIVVANDSTVKAGAWFPLTAKKNLRAQEIAIENKIPILYLVDSAGIYLPLQDEVFADKEHFGRIFRNNAKLSAMGVPQLSAVLGSCVAGGAYLPIMSDETIMVEGVGSIFLAGPYLVKAAIGETIDAETLGGAHTHNAISGVADYKAKDDKEALDILKQIVGSLKLPKTAGFDRIKTESPLIASEEIYNRLPSKRSEAYDTHTIIDAIVDANSFLAYKESYGKSLITGYARIDGWAVGIVANQRKIEKNAKGEMQIGGVIYSDSADKATRFIANCNQKGIPLVFLHDVTGFMVGSKSEHGGIIKDGAKMVNAVSNSVVPKFSVVMGNSYGAGNYAMCGKAYDPRLIVAWPSAEIAVMSGGSASKVLLQIEEAKLQKQGSTLSDKEKQTLLENIESKYKESTSPYYAASRLWVDAIIDPVETRKLISLGIAMANHNEETHTFNMGVLQV